MAAKTTLTELIKKDKGLSDEQKKAFISMANLFNSNFRENIQKTSLEMAEETGMTYDDWKEFLEHASIRNYIDGFVNEQIRKKTDVQLLAGERTRDAASLRKTLREEEKGVDNSNFIIMRMPEKVEYEDD